MGWDQRNEQEDRLVELVLENVIDVRIFDQIMKAYGANNSSKVYSYELYLEEYMESFAKSA